MSDRQKSLLFSIIFLCTIFTFLVFYTQNYRRQAYGCLVPESLSAGALTGSWATTYGTVDQQRSETIILQPDFSYRQVFENGTENRSTWTVIEDEPNGPKIRLNRGLYYFDDNPFTGELELGFVRRPQSLLVQNAARARFRNGRFMGPTDVVDYPQDGFVDLYPRICQGEIKLLGMINSSQDPDNGGLTQPVYLKQSD